MRILWGAIILVTVVSVSVVAMLLVRRRAPDGSYFTDGDRASGVFGMIATGFSVMIGFIVFLAFSAYDSSRVGAEQEALIVTQQIETAQFLPEEQRRELTDGLVCYARSVAGIQWEAQRAGTLGDRLNPWSPVLFETFKKVEPKTASEQSAYDLWLDQTTQREAARNARVHLGAGIIPAPLWIVLFMISAVIFVFVLHFADSGEGRSVQAVLMGSVMAVVVSMLLLLQFFNDPYRPGPGSLQPTAMVRALTIIDEELKVVGGAGPLPCDESGSPIS